MPVRHGSHLHTLQVRLQGVHLSLPSSLSHSLYLYLCLSLSLSFTLFLSHTHSLTLFLSLSLFLSFFDVLRTEAHRRLPAHPVDARLDAVRHDLEEVLKRILELLAVDVFEFLGVAR